MHVWSKDYEALWDLILKGKKVPMTGVIAEHGVTPITSHKGLAGNIYMLIKGRTTAYQIRDERDLNLFGELTSLEFLPIGCPDTSDGYHTFKELYHHRAVLFSVICSIMPNRAWKSKKHADGTMFDGMFIVGIDTPDGPATYHYDIDPYWDMFFDVVDLPNAPEGDGHTPDMAVERLATISTVANDIRTQLGKSTDLLQSARDVLRGISDGELCRSMTDTLRYNQKLLGW